MIKPTHKNIHNKFKLNGFHFTKEELCIAAFSYIKEGLAHEKPLGSFILDWFDEKTYLEIMTSGTTGIPKIIRIEKQAMINSALATGDFFELKLGDKALNCLPVKYIAGKMMFVRALILGLDLDFVAPSSAPMVGNKNNYDFVAMVPLQVENSLMQLHQIKTLIIGGAKINIDLEKKLIQSKCNAFETYSMTETVTHIAAKRVGEKAFLVLPNISIWQDNRNCLVISAPNLSKKNIVTNDIVELVSEHQFIWLGREDNVINSGGIKLFPEQIEAKLLGKITNRFFVAGIASEEFGEQLLLFIEGNPYEIEPSIFNDLDKFEKPKQIKFIPSFAETETGKIKRNEVVASFL
ncbi:O-succinylbenzoic acid--CoA ligase [Flavobacterium psychrophilum]|uniref:AMP-binding protein n=1 Tax=Flavobacterium psychrophilum TaxID=96345 RepID=UPI0009040656|nr:AMP-binding protein [Flavobacterium psychrophilum]ELY2011005.1 AMP-binding protein [Flavobacterium psychrophilum]MBF2093048.1 AMP-binding protein [Flavobacterium psychrophilum]OJH11505.1 O-succinylbenzoic acid--CoA ligase [Flavobacterium psychrophilum]SNA64394.1 O-succinylbenzoate--CoA ligase [Flavobacterium psychrophilum]